LRGEIVVKSSTDIGVPKHFEVNVLGDSGSVWGPEAMVWEVIGLNPDIY